MHQRWFLFTLLWIVCATISAVGGEPEQSSSESQVVQAVRAIDTAEAELFSMCGTYLAINDLLHDKSWEKQQIVLKPNNDAISAALDNYEVRIVVSSDNHHYVMSAAPTSGCGAAMFSSESGVIYSGAALGCK